MGLTKLEELHQEAYDNGIDIYKHHFRTTDKSRSFMEGSIKVIALNKISTDTTAKERTALAEELAHFETNSFYYIQNEFNTPLHRLNRSKAEAQAKRHAVKKTIPASRIKNCWENGMFEVWEIAEELEVTEDFLVYAIEYYRSISMLPQPWEYNEDDF